MMKFKSLLMILLMMMVSSVWAKTLSIQQYDGGNSPVLLKLRQLKQGEAVKFRIVQLGDSHTAGGFLTDELRSVLQKKWGDGGIGAFYPNQIKHQRIANITFPKNNWQTLTSRRDVADFPAGGVLARSSGDSALHIVPNTFGQQTVTLMAKPVFTQNDLQVIDNQKKIINLPAENHHVWQHHTFQAAVPFSILAKSGDLWEMGLIQLENQSDKGILVSALGINGAQWTHSQKWRKDWLTDLAATHADFIILAYGTNEAFQAALNMEETETFWRNQIAQIRQILPESAILLLGAPESLSNTAGQCGVRAPRLDDVQAMQQRVAQDMGVWYASWQEAMGGQCSMNAWRQQGLASKDGVHFTASGYARIGKMLADAIIVLSN